LNPVFPRFLQWRQGNTAVTRSEVALLLPVSIPGYEFGSCLTSPTSSIGTAVLSDRRTFVGIELEAARRG